MTRWQLVPVEATGEQCKAFTDLALHGDVLSEGGWHGYARNQYTAMLSAAPAPDDAAVERVARAMLADMQRQTALQNGVSCDYEDLSGVAVLCMNLVVRETARAAIAALLGEQG